MRIKKPKSQGVVGSRRGIERTAIIILLTLAWCWIMITFGMVFYHGYYKKPAAAATTAATKKGVFSSLTPLHPIAPNRATIAEEPEPELPKLRRHQPSSTQLQSHESPLVIFTCNRAEYLQQTLADILKYIPTDCSIGCPIVISQDGNDPGVVQVIHDYQAKFKQKGIPMVRIEHKSALRRGRNAYQALAVHYGWALGQVFDGKATAATGTVSTGNVLPQRVLILEEDLHIAPDFFSYFAALAPVLDKDSSLFAVSAFNDNGFQSRVRDPKRILRSDFFPGLGWMMTRKLWTQELQMKWPEGYWDDWLRDPAQRKGRHVLRPEISRTFHFGVKGGASLNQFGGLLTQVLLNPNPVRWSQEDFSHLQADKFDREYWSILQSARRVESVEDASVRVKEGDVRIEYTSFPEFQSLASKLQLMGDEKAGILRTAYKGVVETRPYGDHILLLTPPMKDLQKEFQGV
jgi:alpha-1,3-mannosyl-glycoprotein beta-1,2-N-acetylglucosaminyltransferase